MAVISSLIDLTINPLRDALGGLNVIAALEKSEALTKLILSLYFGDVSNVKYQPRTIHTYPWVFCETDDAFLFCAAGIGGLLDFTELFSESNFSVAGRGDASQHPIATFPTFRKIATDMLAGNDLKIKQNKKKKVKLIGHSAGGGCCQVLAASLIKNNIADKIQLVTCGSPSSIDQYNADILKNSLCYNFRGYGDLVWTLMPKTDYYSYAIASLSSVLESQLGTKANTLTLAGDTIYLSKYNQMQPSGHPMFDDEPINSLLIGWRSAWGTQWTPHYVATYIDRLAKLLALKYTQENWHEPAAANLLPDAPEPEDSGGGDWDPEDSDIGLPPVGSGDDWNPNDTTIPDDTANNFQQDVRTLSTVPQISQRLQQQHSLYLLEPMVMRAANRVLNRNTNVDTTPFHANRTGYYRTCVASTAS